MAPKPATPPKSKSQSKNAPAKAKPKPRKSAKTATSSSKSKSAPKPQQRYFLPLVAKVLGIGIFGLCLSAVLAVVYVRYLPPPIGTYMLSERMRLGHLKRDWVPLHQMSVHLPRAVVAAEDADFCQHYGFDFDAIRDALTDDSRVRGGSTISQQVAKNVYLWHGRTWVRKGLEAGFTGLIELTWPKHRIVEVYLNVAEFDEGVFGAKAAAAHYFGVTPDIVTATEAARLAAILPSPKRSSASRPSSYIRKRSSQIRSGAATIAVDGRADCLLGG